MEVCGYVVYEGAGAQRGKFEEREMAEDIIVAEGEHKDRNEGNYRT